MKKLTAVLVIGMFVGLVFLPRPAAADVRLGIKGGANMARLNGEDLALLEDTWKSKLGFCVGGFLAISLGDVLTIQPEVLYTMKGAEFTEVEIITYTGKLFLDYIEIPVLLKLRLPVGGIAPFVFAGPSVGFILSEKLKLFEDGEYIGEEPIEDEIKNVDYGAVFGGGLELGRSFHIDVRYSLGLQKLGAEGLDALDIKNGVLSATVGIAF